MAKTPRDAADLEKQLDEQLQFIRNSAQSFDEGFEGEAKRLATTIRVLVHDTTQSHSLIDQLGLKGKIQFQDLSLPFDPNNLLSHSGLTKIFMKPDGSRVLPLFDESPVPARSLSFDDWWNGIVFVDQRRVEHSRKDLVLALANQDGGAHVDPKLDEEYARLSRGNSLGWMEVRNGLEQPSPDQVPAAVRHIAHELLKSVDPSYIFKEHDHASEGLLMMGAAIHKSTEPLPLPLLNRKKTPRNDPCPCGSGKKFKKCCGAWDAA